AVHERWLHEVTVARMRPAAREDLPVRRLDFRDRLLIRRDRGLVNDGTQIHIADRRVPHLQLLRLRDELRQERVFHASFDEDPGARGALLPTVPERRTHYA